MADFFDNFELGLDGIEDLAHDATGLGDGGNIAAGLAREATDAQVAAGNVAPEDAAAFQEKLAERAAPVIEQQGGATAAAKATVNQIASNPLAVFGLPKWALPVALGVAALLVVAYVVTLVRSFIPRGAA